MMVSSDSEESSSSRAFELVMYRCKLCPNMEFTAEERAIHRLAHPELKMKREGQEAMQIFESVIDELPEVSPKRTLPQDKRETFNQSAPLNMELPLVFPGGQRGTVKLSLVVTLENGAPNIQVKPEAPKLSKLERTSTSKGAKIVKSLKRLGNSAKGKNVYKKYPPGTMGVGAKFVDRQSSNFSLQLPASPVQPNATIQETKRQKRNV